MPLTMVAASSSPFPGCALGREGLKPSGMTWCSCHLSPVVLVFSYTCGSALCGKGSFKAGMEREREISLIMTQESTVIKFLRNGALFFFLQGLEVEVQGKQEPWRKDPGKGAGTWQHHEFQGYP